MKVIDTLKKQLSTDKDKEAAQCIKIYNKLLEIDNGHIWGRTWQTLTKVIRITPELWGYMPTKVGEVFLKGLEN